MRHSIRGRKLNRTKSHRDAMFSNLASSLFEHKKIHTTEAKAKDLRPFAEALITKAKNALIKEKQKLLPTGQTVDIHNRRLVGRYIRNKAILQELFDAIAPAVETRNGGYLRITKTGTRRGDAARTAIVELVDWSAPVDGAVSMKRKKKKSTAKSKAGDIQAKEPTTKKVDKEQQDVALAEDNANVEIASNEVVSTENANNETAILEATASEADNTEQTNTKDNSSEKDSSTEEVKE
jgi:large subunit ribosomal protein L17